MGYAEIEHCQAKKSGKTCRVDLGNFQRLDNSSQNSIDLRLQIYLAEHSRTDMNIKGFIWLDQVVEKLRWKHDVVKEEVEEAFENDSKFKFGQSGNYNGENLYYCFGRTEAGRYLYIVFIYKKSEKALILSARDMTRRERRTYEQM